MFSISAWLKIFAISATLSGEFFAAVEGFLGESYPGYFPPGDASGLAERLHQAAHDEVYYRRLQIACAKLAPMLEPSCELQSWAQLLSSLA